MNKLVKGWISILAALSTVQTANACTDLRLTAKDGTVIISRTMEFAGDLQSNLRSSPRGRHFNFTAPNGVQGSTWNAKYGYLYLDGANQNYAVDGMNEVGLSVEALYLPGMTKYQTVPAGKEGQAIPYISFGDWVLSNFKTVDEVRQALSAIYVFEQTLSGMGDMVFPLHFSIYEASGKGIVIEFVNGQMSISDSIGILTNNPTYSWQVTNLRNFLNLSPY
ncbi:MAG: linear amide C-N hydrolase, partial [Gammaproteobacteria bacterium]